MKTVGFLTSQEDANLIDDDRLAFPYLNKLGYNSIPVVWDQLDPTSEIPFDALIFRSCWDYHTKYPQFCAWLESLKQQPVPIFNPVSTLQWNLNKAHIIELANAVRTPKTVHLKAGTKLDTDFLNDIALKWATDKIIAKPAVSLNGIDTYLIDRLDFATKTTVISDLLKSRDMLIQEFIPEIKTLGETSLVFLNRKFNHAVQKIPAKHEFRVHKEYGGSREYVRPSEHALNYALDVLAEIKGDLLYARVDIVDTPKYPILIELELTDPMLYLHTHSEAPAAFARAIADRLN